MNYYLGTDVGGTNLAAAVVDENYNILSHACLPAGSERGIEEITADIYNVAYEAAQKAGFTFDDFEYWGIGMPSCINPKTGLLVHANCFRWHNADVFSYLKRHTDIPIYIENDANCAVLGEQLSGAARGNNNVLLLTIGTGLGSGIIIDGQIFAGADGMGAELGHTKLVYQGIQCTCGQYGCAESYCSATALKRLAKEKMNLSSDSEIDIKELMEAAERGEQPAEDIIDEYIGYLAAGISTFITILRPEIIILGGGVSQSGEFFYEKLRAKLPKSTFAGFEVGVPNVTRATLGNDAGLIGAAFLGKHKGRHLIAR